MILIGSRALQLRAPHLLTREPKDFDFIATVDEAYEWIDKNSFRYAAFDAYWQNNHKLIFNGGEGTSGIIAEFEIISEYTPFEQLENNRSGLMYDFLVRTSEDRMDIRFGDMDIQIPNLNLLFTLKASHRYLKNSPHFWKTLSDYHAMQAAGAEVKNEYLPFFHQREKETYNYNHPKLNQKKDQFFSNDNIEYRYDHDSIHKAVAYFDNPAYTYYIQDGEEVKADRKKFFKLPIEVRYAGVIEEAATLAIERSLVPHPGKMSIEKAWLYAFSKVLTSITSGWFREFAYENAEQIIKLWSLDKERYWIKFIEGLRSGLIKYYNLEHAESAPQSENDLSV